MNTSSNSLPLFYTMVYTSPSKVARIVKLKNIGQSDYEIGCQFGLHHTTIPCLIKRFSESGDPYFQKHKPGHPHKLQECDACHRALLLACTEAANVTELTKQAFLHVSCITVSRALHQYGLVSRVRRSKPWISPVNVAKRKAWAAEHVGWTVEDWKQVIFSDESKFMLFKSDGHQYCWMKPGQALDPRFTKKTIKHGGGNVMVWGCITGEGMGRLHQIEGIMNGPGYVDILHQSLLGTLKDWKLKKMGKDKVIFQQDNDPKHTLHIAGDWFQKRKVTVLPWPPSSPDMNIIEHVWDQLDHLIRAQNPLPRNKDEMWQALQEEWANFPKEALDKLYESMPRRVAALKEARGYHTKY